MSGVRSGVADPTCIWHDAQAEVHRVSVGPMDNRVYVVRCRATGAGLLVDAANEHERLLELCRHLDVAAVVETHGHWDHIQAVEQVRDAGYRVGVTAQDAAMLPSYDDVLDDDDVLTIGRLRVRTILTPGHTAGSMCFHLEGSPLLFTGDTLFPGGPGNTSFPGSSFEQIIESIDRRLFAPYGADTLVYPGHGEGTTLGTERPHLQEWVDRGW